MFVHNKKLMELRLEGNRLICNCHLSWLNQLSSVCLTSDDHINRLIADQTISQSEPCSEPNITANVATKHSLDSSDQLQKASNQIDKAIGTNLAINCPHSGHRFWLKNNEPINYSSEANRIQLSANGSLIITSLLVTDSATYTCRDQSGRTIISYSVQVSGNFLSITRVNQVITDTRRFGVDIVFTVLAIVLSLIKHFCRHLFMTSCKFVIGIDI